MDINRPAPREDDVKMAVRGHVKVEDGNDASTAEGCLGTPEAGAAQYNFSFPCTFRGSVAHRCPAFGPLASRTVRQ